MVVGDARGFIVVASGDKTELIKEKKKRATAMPNMKEAGGGGGYLWSPRLLIQAKSQISNQAVRLAAEPQTQQQVRAHAGAAPQQPEPKFAARRRKHTHPVRRSRTKGLRMRSCAAGARWHAGAGTLACQVVGFSLEPWGFSVKRASQLEGPHSWLQPGSHCLKQGRGG